MGGEAIQSTPLWGLLLPVESRDVHLLVFLQAQPLDVLPRETSNSRAFFPLLALDDLRLQRARGVPGEAFLIPALDERDALGAKLGREQRTFGDGTDTLGDQDDGIRCPKMHVLGDDFVPTAQLLDSVCQVFTEDDRRVWAEHLFKVLLEPLSFAALSRVGRYTRPPDQHGKRSFV